MKALFCEGDRVLIGNDTGNGNILAAFSSIDGMSRLYFSEKDAVEWDLERTGIVQGYFARSGSFVKSALGNRKEELTPVKIYCYSVLRNNMDKNNLPIVVPEFLLRKFESLETVA